MASLLACASFPCTAHGGYLPTVGPPPIRFQPSRVMLPEKDPLPTLSDEETGSNSAIAIEKDKLLTASRPSVSNSTLSHSGHQEGVESSQDPEEVSPSPSPKNSLPAPGNPDDPSSSKADETTRVLPQMFLKYFDPGPGNEPGIGVLAPLEFRPPAPAPIPSSRAQYSVAPSRNP